MHLECRDLLDRAIPPLARRLGVEPNEARALIESPGSSLVDFLANSQESETRQQINNWWREFNSDFSNLSLGILNRVSRPAQLPEPTYIQVACLTWVTGELRLIRLTERMKRKDEEYFKAQPNFWQIVVNWLKRLFNR